VRNDGGKVTDIANVQGSRIADRAGDDKPGLAAVCETRLVGPPIGYRRIG
jgi:hypothetical protein